MLLRAVLEPSPVVVEELRLLCARMAAAGLHPVPPERLELVLARFGNVTPSVAQRLAGALVEGLGGMSGCAVALAGPRIDGRAVVADLAGEVDQVRAVAAQVARVAAKRAIYVDRRVFRSGVVLAEPDPLLRGSAIEARLDRLSGWHSSPWEAATVTLVRTAWRGVESVAERWYTVPLVAHDEEQRLPLG